MLSSWWVCLVWAMTADGPCQNQMNMKEPISRVPVTVPVAVPAVSLSRLPGKSIGLLSQARKALSERAPFDAAEDGAEASTSLTLPSRLASILKHSDSRKRQKKLNLATESKKKKKKKSSSATKTRGSNIWIEHDDYFRNLALPDIDTLCNGTSVSPLGSSKCLLIPVLEGDSVGVSDGNEGSGGICPDSESGKEERSEQDVEIDSVGGEIFPQEEENVCSVSDSSSGIEWLLGCRNKAYMASERSSKKRKLLCGDAEKIFAVQPCGGLSSMCDFCGKGDEGGLSNPLIVCSSCKVAVHKRCYGVEEEVGNSWLCSWCAQKNGGGSSGYPCILCSRQGGALKPVHNTGEDTAVKFAHLFCSLWMPEVFIDDVKKMEPVMNVNGILETRRKLVCNVCKMKCGACVRCSHGTCRTSFHPLCGREAKQSMEVWGNYGLDNVELRAFCLKHSELKASGITSQPASLVGVPVASSHSANPFSVKLPSGASHSPKADGGYGGGIANEPELCADSDKSESGLQDPSLSDKRSICGSKPECIDPQLLSHVEKLEFSDTEDIDSSNSLDIVRILKMLIDRGKVNMKDMAADIGISVDILAAKLADNNLVPELRSKMVKWLKNHAYVGALHKDPKLTIRSSISSKAQDAMPDESDTVAVSDSDLSTHVAVKSVPPRRRTKNNIRIVKENVFCSSKDSFGDHRTVIDRDQLAFGEEDKPSVSSVPVVSEKLETKEEGDVHPSCHGNLNILNSNCSNSPRVSSLINPEAGSNFYMHPLVYKSMVEMQGMGLTEDLACKTECRTHGSRLAASQDAGVCCNHESEQCDASGVEQLAKARKTKVLDLSPNDELEGEIIYFQHRLLGNAISRIPVVDNLTYRIAKNLPQEIDEAHSQRWDAVLANRYLYELREAKKQGRKERKHKEAQAVLAAATAAAAASSRISSARKDSIDESGNQGNNLKFNTTHGRVSQLVPRPKETLPPTGLQKESPEKHTEFSQLSHSSKDHARSCDICNRSETILNPILVCSSCKVSVHLDCYRSVRESIGPWYCELCEEMRSSGAPTDNYWEKSTSAAECALCGGTAGAFRKSADGQWVHAFCAEWVFEATFRRGQAAPIEGMNTLQKGVHECNICHHKSGVCIKCNYGHCQITFHPSCARSVGLFMNVKAVAGKLQHKAFCEKHSIDQKAKVESQRYGAEELKNMKQIRVELEKLRLLCERIIKREKVKREIVVCTHEILSLRQKLVTRSLLAQNSFLSHDGSSESATTSLNRSGNEGVQKSDDMTVDSKVSFRLRAKGPLHGGTEQKTDDSVTSENILSRKHVERSSFSGKHIPQRPPIASRNVLDDGELRSRYKKHAETFEKELVMTSDQADLKNKLLPKGYAYVPSDTIPNEKGVNQNPRSGVPMEHG